MKCSVSLLIIGWACVVGAAAQPQRGPVFPQDKGPQGEAKLRWVCERLNLDKQQLGQVEGALIPVYQAEIEAERADGGLAIMEQIQVKFSEIQNLEATGDTEGANKLRAELRDLAPGVRPEKHFFASLEHILIDEQKAGLPRLLEEVRNAPDPSRPVQPPPPRPQPPTESSKPVQQTERPEPPQPTPTPAAPPATAVELRPVHVLAAVLEVGLTPDQRRQVEEALGDFRDEQGKNRPLNPTERDTRVERLVQALRPLLNAAQTKEFDENIAALRENVPQAKTITLPGAAQQPAARPGPPQRPRPRPAPPDKE